MKMITEEIDAYPNEEPVLSIKRNEQLLFAKPGPPVSNFMTEYHPLEVVHFDTKYVPEKFAPPRDVYANDHVRVEWQKMSQRQPFYHRNADVDEISYHICGKRTLMTERGSVDLEPGDFARLPVNTSHDNRGVEDVHLIFYFLASAKETMPSLRKTEYKTVPYEGWEAKTVCEMMTACLATIGCDKACSLVDETMILRTASESNLDPITVFNSSQNSSGDTLWYYKTNDVWLGSATMFPTEEGVYHRHRCADEIQCQISGTRTLITQRGTVELKPGDFVNIPLGTAFTSIVKEESTHVSVLTRITPEPKARIVRKADETTWDLVQTLRM